MSKIYTRLLMSVFVCALGLIISANLPDGKLLALQTAAGAGSSSSQENSGGTGSTGVGQDSNSSATGTQAPGQRTQGAPGAEVSRDSGTAPATNQASADTDSSRSFSWGSLAGSFIVGLIIGGLIFGTRRPSRIDRDNSRRAA